MSKSFDKQVHRQWKKNESRKNEKHNRLYLMMCGRIADRTTENILKNLFEEATEEATKDNPHV